MTIISSTGSSSQQSYQGERYTFALTSLTFLFFIWGFITCLNDILIPHLKNIFDLSFTEASLVQFCFFGAYFLVSIPAGGLIRKIGYQNGIVVGLLVAASGAVLFYPAAAVQSYALFLGALFVLASGITILQVAANPFVTILGSPDTASSRLTMTQAFNSLGTTLAPQFGALLILGAVTAMPGTQEYKIQEAQSVQLPYLALSVALVVTAILFFFLKLPKVHNYSAEQATQTETSFSLWKYPHLVLGVIGIFVYVGGEVAIGSFLVSFMQQQDVAAMTESEAGLYLSYYWGGAMVGRFIGAAVMQKVAATKVLAFNSVATVLLIILAMLATGPVAMWSLLLVGLFNSIMFPTIFSLALKGLGLYTSKGSGLLCAAIVGGALIPVAQGVVADLVGLQLSFVVPLLCYCYICFYALRTHFVNHVAAH